MIAKDGFPVNCGKLASLDFLRRLLGGVFVFRAGQDCAAQGGKHLVVRSISLGQFSCKIALQQEGQLREARAFQQTIHDVCADSPGVEIPRCLGRQTQLHDFIILSIRHSCFPQKEIRGNTETFCDPQQILAVQPVRRAGEKPAQRAFRDVDALGKVLLRDLLMLHQIQNPFPCAAGKIGFVHTDPTLLSFSEYIIAKICPINGTLSCACHETTGICISRLTKVL